MLNSCHIHTADFTLVITFRPSHNNSSLRNFLAIMMGDAHCKKGHSGSCTRRRCIMDQTSVSAAHHTRWCHLSVTAPHVGLTPELRPSREASWCSSYLPCRRHDFPRSRK